MYMHIWPNTNALSLELPVASLGEERAPMQKTADACMKGGADKRGSEGRREGWKEGKKWEEEKTFWGIGRKKGHQG